MSANSTNFVLFLFLTLSYVTMRVAQIISRVQTFPSYNDFFHYQVPFLVSFDFDTWEDASNATWSVPDDCSVQKTRSVARKLELEVLCLQPGTKLITVKQNVSVAETVRVTLDDSVDCYSWYSVIDSNKERQSVNGTWYLDIRIWVVNHRHSSDEERNEKTLLPSQHSKTLTLQFYALGEEAELQWLGNAGDNTFQVERRSFNASHGFWQFVVVSSLGELRLSVHGSGVIILGCGIRDGVALVSARRVTFPNQTSSLTKVLTNRSIKLKQHQQETSIAILMLQTGTLLTANNFKTSEEFRLSFEALSNVTADDAAFVEKNMLLLINSTVHVVSLAQASAISVSQLDRPVDRMQSAAVAIHDPSVVAASGLVSTAVAVWNGKDETGIFFLSLDGGITFSSISLPLSAESLRIWAIGFHPFRPVAVLLAARRSGRSESKFYYYNYKNNRWETRTDVQFSLDSDSHVTQLDFVWFPSGSGELLLWDSTQVYYSQLAGETWSLLRFSEGPYLRQASLHPQEFVYEVCAARDGTFVILTTTKRLFVGHAGKEDALLVSTVAGPGSDATVAFDSSSRLFLVITQPSNAQIERHYVTLRQLIQNALQRDNNCPYIHWANNVRFNLQYVDKNEMVQLWSYIVPMAWKTNELTKFVSDPFVVNVATESVEQPAATKGILVRNETLFLSELAADYSQVSQRSEVVSVKMMPLNSTLMCSPPREAVSHLLLGCPPHRTIKVASPNDKDSRYCKSYAAYQSSSLRRPRYNYSVYGCPLRIKYGEAFLPNLILYDGNQPIDTVWANLIVLDELGDSGLTYSHTARQVGCVSVPEWLRRLQAQTDVNFTVPSQGYYSCYNGSGGESGDPSLYNSYPILNSSSPNRLRLSAHDGLYLFKVKVIANDYSYCHLETRFSVEIYGTPYRSVAGYAVLGSCCLFAIGLLVMTYYCLRSKLRKRSTEDKDK